jgi:hypothetical protein
VEGLLILGLFPCSIILLYTALILALASHKRSAISCAGFGVVALIIGFWYLPGLAAA